MRKILEIAFLMFVSLKGYGQCDKNKVVFVDSSWNAIHSTLNNPIYVLTNEKDTLFLDSLFDLNLTLNKGLSSKINEQTDTTSYCIVCMRKEVKLIDSIDINHDGFKELFIFREWYCSASPKFPSYDGFGIGGQQQDYSRYEVWDVQTKSKLFEVNNRVECQVTASVSVVRSTGYKFEVKIDEKGSFNLFNHSGNTTGELEMGIYKYDNESKTYKKE